MLNRQARELPFRVARSIALRVKAILAQARNGMTIFNHSNVRLPRVLDRMLRWMIVTPDMHRVHHSIEDDETNSNFGFNLSWWDRLFGTYRQQPRAGHENMTIGIRGFRDSKQCITLPGLLSLPFIGKVTGYAINRRQWDDQHGTTASTEKIS